MLFVSDFFFLLPEIYFFIFLNFFLIFGLFFGRSTWFTVEGTRRFSFYRSTVLFPLIIFIILLYLLCKESLLEIDQIYLLNGTLSLTSASQFFKLILLIFLFFFIFFAVEYSFLRQLPLGEFMFFCLVSLLGSFFIIGVEDFLSFYVFLEMHSLALYLLAAFSREDRRSSEAGLKYFILGTFSSIFLLFGVTVLYSLTGSLTFSEISLIISDLSLVKIQLGYFGALVSGVGVAALFGFGFILLGLFFKLGVFPFYMWLPDVYEGSPTTSTAFFSVFSKLPIIVFLFQFMVKLDLFPFFEELQSVIMFMGGATAIVGVFGALIQQNIKRFLAYSGFTHIGFILISLGTFSLNGIEASFIYLFVYMFLSINFFGLFLSVENEEGEFHFLSDLSSVFHSYPSIGFCFILNLFSMAGIPPLIGFFSKFYLIYSLFSSGLLVWAGFVIILSGISVFYYIRIVRLMVFDLRQNREQYTVFSFVGPSGFFNFLLTSLNVLGFVFFFFVLRFASTNIYAYFF